MTFRFGDKFPMAMKQLKRYNILVIGNTGIGKSTIIGELCQIQLGNSINKTQNISDPYIVIGQTIHLYDTPGMESSNEQRKKNKQEIYNFIKKHKQKEPQDQIHSVWYCVNSQTTRSTDIDISWIESIAKEIPVTAVITRVSDERIVQRWLQPFLENIKSINEVLLISELPALVTGHNYHTSYGFDKLLQSTENLLPRSAKQSISNAINTKGNKSLKWCISGSTLVLASQLQPVPFVKTLCTPGLQFWMFCQIAKEFDLKFHDSVVKEFLSVGTISAISIDLNIENILNNLPINTDNIKNVHDFLCEMISMLNNISDIVPFKDQIIELLNSVSLNPFASLPIINCVALVVKIMSTALLGIAFVETMKYAKELEYDGKSQVSTAELIKYFQDKYRYLIKLIAELLNSENGFSAA
jgi:GTP-binding protein EngB required for normal cell division